MLLGAVIIIYMDHTNVVVGNLSTQRVLRWRSYPQGYSPRLNNLEGYKTVLADSLSRYHCPCDKDELANVT